MRVSVVIPCYKVKRHILSVISKIGIEVEAIYIVDDACPEGSGKIVQEHCRDSRVKVLYNTENQGVGGAVVQGYRQAYRDGMEIVVKLDGDGQMDPSGIRRLIQPIQSGKADYTKGNRFFTLESLSSMPRIRLIGNAMLSLVNKATSGYWQIMDPTNGYTAIHTSLLTLLPLEKIEKRFFFESDVLFRLNTIRAVVQDVPMPAVYNDEESNLSVKKVFLDFPHKYLMRFFKRVFYNYFLRDFNACSLELLIGLFLVIGGVIFGSWCWVHVLYTGVPTTSGTVMLATLPIILGVQMIIAAISYDVANIPTVCLSSMLSQNKNFKEDSTLNLYKEAV